ncbi:MAG: EF-hand domain-containing protein [Hyphomicrobiales bacterium]
MGRHSILSKSFLVMLFFVIPSAGLATEVGSHYYSTDSYENLEEIPKFLKESFRKNRYLEKYIVANLRYIRTYARDKTTLTQETIELLISQDMERARNKEKKKFNYYDIDQDNRVDAHEIKQVLVRKNPSYAKPKQIRLLEQQISHGMAKDADGDGYVSYEEMLVVSPHIRQKFIDWGRGKFATILLKLDPNEDGMLTIIELEKLSLKAFATVDIDGDSIISKAELGKIQTILHNQILAERDLKLKRREDRKKAWELAKTRHKLPDECKFKNLSFPNNLLVYSMNGSNGREIQPQVGPSGQHTQVDIVVNEPGKSVALLLAAHNGVIWSINRTEGTKIHSVVVSGLKKQVIVGIDAETPVLIHTKYDEVNCNWFSIYAKGRVKPNTIAMAYFGKPVSKIFKINKRGYTIMGSQDYNANNLLSSDFSTPEKFTATLIPLSGKAGIETGIKDGFLKLANEDDIRVWEEKFGRKRKTVMFTRTDENGKLTLHKGVLSMYVVLKNYAIPTGLYGANAVKFLVPKGVNMPLGNGGHSAIFNFNDLTCSGSLCGRK